MIRALQIAGLVTAAIVMTMIAVVVGPVAYIVGKNAVDQRKVKRA